MRSKKTRKALARHSKRMVKTMAEIKNFVAIAPWAIPLLPERYADNADILRAASAEVAAALAAVAKTTEVA